MKSSLVSLPILVTVLIAGSAQAERLPAVAELLPDAQPIFMAQSSVVLEFQTITYTVRIFSRNDTLIMNIFDRQNNILWLRDLVVVATETRNGYIYTAINSDIPIEVFQSQSGSAASVTLENRTENATLVTVATVPPVDPEAPPAAPVPPTNAIRTCWAFPNTAYIYRRSGELHLDIINRDSNEALLRGALVTLMPSSEGMNYLHEGRPRAEVFTSDYDGSCAIAIDDNPLEFGTQP